MRPDALDRHDLVSIRPGGPDPFPRPLPGVVRSAWTAAGCPLVVRRGPAGDGLPLGLPLPPTMGKTRVAVVLPLDRVAPRPTPGPAEVRHQAPISWRATLVAAADLGRDHGVRVTPYGGLLWQALLGLDFLHPGSDLDLLWRCPGPVPARFLDCLARLAREAPMRLDGEVVVAGCGVHWRELATAGPGQAVLCKTRAGVRMRPAGELLASCPA